MQQAGPRSGVKQWPKVRICYVFCICLLSVDKYELKHKSVETPYGRDINEFDNNKNI